MISVDEARELIASQIESQPTESIGLTSCLGRTIAEPTASDRDSPPHDKSLMDGYAIAADSYQRGKQYRVVEQVVAGQVPTISINGDSATRIMTGAPIPSGASAVVMVEQSQTKEVSGVEHVVFDADTVSSNQNILRRGCVMRAGETVVGEGTEVTPAVVGLLAEIGAAEPVVFRRPSVAILSTGNELVDHWESPGPGCIRNSNGPMIAASVIRAGGEPLELGIAPDDKSELENAIERGLECDILVMSGGVSAGVLDLTPQVLDSCGVKEVFHKVNLKPGKPLWFGKRASTATCKSTLVFGLPGNPVSGFVCFELFVRYAMRAMTGQGGGECRPAMAKLANTFHQKARRDTYYPGRIVDATKNLVEPLRWQGSADLRTIANADGLIYFPGEPREYEMNSDVLFYSL